MTRDASQANSPALQVKKEQHIVRFQSFERKHFRSEEVRPHHDCHVSTDEIFPSGVLLPLWRWRDIMPLKNVADGMI